MIKTDSDIKREFEQAYFDDLSDKRRYGEPDPQTLLGPNPEKWIPNQEERLVFPRGDIIFIEEFSKGNLFRGTAIEREEFLDPETGEYRMFPIVIRSAKKEELEMERRIREQRNILDQYKDRHY